MHFHILCLVLICSVSAACTTPNPKPPVTTKPLRSPATSAAYLKSLKNKLHNSALYLPDSDSVQATQHRPCKITRADQTIQDTRTLTYNKAGDITSFSTSRDRGDRAPLINAQMTYDKTGTLISYKLGRFNTTHTFDATKTLTGVVVTIKDTPVLSSTFRHQPNTRKLTNTTTYKSNGTNRTFEISFDAQWRMITYGKLIWTHTDNQSTYKSSATTPYVHTLTFKNGQLIKKVIEDTRSTPPQFLEKTLYDYKDNKLTRTTRSTASFNREPMITTYHYTCTTPSPESK